MALVVSLAMLIPLSKLLKGKNKNKASQKSLNQLANEYQLVDSIYRVRVPANSPIVQKKLIDLNLPLQYNLIVTEIRRHSRSSRLLMKEVQQEIAGAGTVFFAGDTIHLLGASKDVAFFAKENNLQLIESEEGNNKSFQFFKVGIAEVLLLPDSFLENKTVLDAQFRTRYGVNILCVQRKGNYIVKNLKSLPFLSGDTLLVQGSWDNIRKLSEEINNWVVLGRPLEEAAKETLDHKMPLAAF